MRILITGSDGQLAQAIQRVAIDDEVIPFGRHRLDIASPDAPEIVRAAVADVVVNTAAMTDVDACERDPDAAFRINALGARNVAVGAAMAGSTLVQISTDYVFSGRKGAAYWEFDTPDPISVYGASKHAGEQLVSRVHSRTFIVRSAWLYGLGGRNFVTRILDLARQRPHLEVVDTEVGSPTFCDDLAGAILRLVRTQGYGIHHLVNEGGCSRFEFAREILRQAGREDVVVVPTDRYERDATPPAYAPLRNFAAAELGIRLPPWQESLERFFYLRSESIA